MEKVILVGELCDVHLLCIYRKFKKTDILLQTHLDCFAVTEKAA